MLRFKHFIDESIVPDVKQKTDVSCGVACVVSILKFFKLPALSEAELIAQLKTSKQRGTAPEMIVKYLKSVGLTCKTSSDTSLDQLTKLTKVGPVICLVQQPYVASGKNGHWVVVQDVNDKISVMDPEIGTDKNIDIDKFQKNWFDKTVKTKYSTDRFCISVSQ